MGFNFKIVKFCSRHSAIFGHSHKAWKIVSEDERHCSQISSESSFLFHRLCLTGIVLWQSRHRKFLTLFGTESLQILFQMSLSWAWLDRGARRLVSFFKNLVPDFIENTPDELKGHITLSSVGRWLSEMLRIKSTSSGWNSPCMRSVAHLLEVGFMRSETFASSKPGITCERIFGCSREGNQASFHTVIDSPHPSLHLAPWRISSLPTNILRHACEPE